MKKKIEISAVVPVDTRYEKSTSLAKDYLESLQKMDKSFELVFVLDSRHAELCDELTRMTKKHSQLKIIRLTRGFGEAAALTAGFEQTTGEIVLTLPAYYQIQAPEIHKLIDGLENSDVAIGARWPRASKSKFESFRRKIFHWMVGGVVGDTFKDLGCGARALRRTVVEEGPIYGDQHRYIPRLAIRRGVSICEVEVLQSEKDQYKGGYSPRVYVRYLLDLLTVFFLVRFTKKPLRFFGMIGTVTFAVGALFMAYVVFERLFFDVALADRPALLISSLLVVLGLQIFALGLLGELIIFTHAQEIKEYTIEEIIN
ncbi:MAG: hypothetical protein DRR15_19755 [Gammaproteobacteria bacterium]|nr:MAG: hypothetical protein DRR15_19755 [Gammaproteobacteria bacterium]